MQDFRPFPPEFCRGHPVVFLAPLLLVFVKPWLCRPEDRQIRVNEHLGILTAGFDVVACAEDQHLNIFGRGGRGTESAGSKNGEDGENPAWDVISPATRGTKF